MKPFIPSPQESERRATKAPAEIKISKPNDPPVTAKKLTLSVPVSAIQKLNPQHEIKTVTNKNK